ncbi:MAG TPA: hypothetical protein VGM24_12015, partial [Puia sp.]
MACYKRVIFFFIGLTGLSAYGQTVARLDSISQHFIESRRSEAGEKIFLQTDKWYYAAGEDIWFRAYCMNAISHKPSRHSKTLFVDLVNDRDSPVCQLLLNNQELQPGGRISLPSFLPEGYYWLRAYTRDILRDDSNRIYVQPVYLLSRNKPGSSRLTGTPESPAAPVSESGPPQLIFYPEGGAIVQGTNTTVGIYAQDKSGKPLTVSGNMADGRGIVLSGFKTSFQGLGKSVFFATKSGVYTAQLRDSGNTGINYPLPRTDPFSS